MVFRVRREPAPCAWALGSTEGLTGWENWLSDIEELKRSTTHIRIMSGVRSRYKQHKHLIMVECVLNGMRKPKVGGVGLSHIGLFHLMNVRLCLNLQVLGCFYISLDTFLGHICHSKLGGLWLENYSGMMPLKVHACSIRFLQKCNHSNYIPVVLIRCWPMCLLLDRQLYWDASSPQWTNYDE